MSLGEILTQATIDEESLSEATNCDPMPASSNESEKSSCSSSNTAFQKSPQASKGPSQSSCGKERETIMLNNTFPDIYVHQQNLCCIKHTCELVYSVKSPTEKVSKFQHSMLSRPEAYDPETEIWWLVFQANEGMFCLLCEKHDTHNAKNKTKYFNEIPAIRFKPETIRVHADSPQHKLAIQLEMLQRGSEFQKQLDDKEKNKGKECKKIFEVVYWLAKEELPNRKLSLVLEMIKMIAGVDLKRQFPYSSRGIERELF